MDPMDPYTYVIRQRCAGSCVWTSPEAFEGDFHEVAQAIVGGYIPGEARWAETLDGMFIYGIDSLGREHKTGTTDPDFSV